MWWSQSQNYGHTMRIAVKLYRANLAEVKMRIYSRKLDFLNENFLNFTKNMVKIVILEAHWRHTLRNQVETI